MLTSYIITNKPSTVKKPQESSVIEKYTQQWGILYVGVYLKGASDTNKRELHCKILHGIYD